MPNENIDYLIEFDADGNRGATYRKGIHYQSADDDFVKQKLADGFVFVSAADYNNLLGNNADKQTYIRQTDGTYIPKPPYVPTAEEEQASKLAALDSQYSATLDDLKEQIVVASTVDQDEDYANELRVERQNVQAEYIQKRGEI